MNWGDKVFTAFIGLIIGGIFLAGFMLVGTFVWVFLLGVLYYFIP